MNSGGKTKCAEALCSTVLPALTWRLAAALVTLEECGLSCAQSLRFTALCLCGWVSRLSFNCSTGNSIHFAKGWPTASWQEPCHLRAQNGQTWKRLKNAENDTCVSKLTCARCVPTNFIKKALG